MGYDYANVHLYYTIPPAVLLTAFYWPFFSKLDAYKVTFLVTIAVTATIPWDSYLIRTKVWTYPEHVIIGPKLFDIPLEEVFFFVIQTYNTSLLYLIVSKPTFRPSFLRHEDILDKWRYVKNAGTLVIGLSLRRAFSMWMAGGQGTYLALILLWAFPFLGLLWNLAYQFILGLTWTETALPIALPTVYLWIVDTLALRRGTWVIESGTKLDIHLWPGLEIEEAIFFLLTNMMIVFGLVAFDNAVAVLDTFRTCHPSTLPSPLALIKALLVPAEKYDQQRLHNLRQAVSLLRAKSRSFYLASSVFERGLRTDLIVLYTFCRVADDLVDTSKSSKEAQDWINKLRRFLDISYEDRQSHETTRQYVLDNFPQDAQFALLELPTHQLPQDPLYDLLKGFETDLEFDKHTPTPSFPIATESDLDAYGERVAGTVAVLCLAHVWSDSPDFKIVHAQRKTLEAAGSQMGIALQYVNIARDLTLDAQANRLYIPTRWIEDLSCSPAEILSSLSSAAGATTAVPKPRRVPDKTLLTLRQRLLERAFALYTEARPAIEQLPPRVRPAMRVAVESYMEIGRTLRAATRDALMVLESTGPETDGRVGLEDPFERASVKGLGSGAGRATVPLSRRLMVAYRALIS